MSGGDVRRGRTTSFSEAVEMEIVYRRGVGREELAERQPTSKAERSKRVRRVGQERQPSFSRRNLQKIAVRYVFMAEALLRGPERDVDAVERADQLTSRLRLDGGT